MERNESNHNIRLRSQFIYKENRLKYLGLVLKENELIVKDLLSRIRYNYIKKQKPTKTAYNKITTLNCEREVL